MSNLQKTIQENKPLLGLLIVISLVAGAVGDLVVRELPGYIESTWNSTEPTASRPGSAGQVYYVEEESQSTKAVEKISPSVVSIIITKDINKLYNQTGRQGFPFDDFFNFGGQGFNFIPPQPSAPEPKSQKPNKQEIGGGTGFFISEDGLILTNKHVVADTEADYSVLTNDGKRYDAKVLARDPSNDIAVVKVVNPDSKFVPAELGDSDKIKIGQTVIAVGNSLGEYRNTVTKGVVSGIGRKVVAGDQQGRSETLEEAIQTDAAINPGNSGGPLVNIAGQVIAINSAVNQAGQLIGFAIPINQAKQDIESVKTVGRIVRPFLGVRYVLINDQIASKNNLKVSYGALVLRGDQPGDLAIVPGSPADKAGLVENDIILEVNGVKINVDNGLAKVVGKFKPNDEINMKILHRGEEKTIKVKLGEFKES